MYTKYNYTYLCKSICILQYVKLIKYSYIYKSMYTKYNYTYLCKSICILQYVKLIKYSYIYKSMYTKYNYTYLCKSFYQYCGLYISETYNFTSITIF